MLKFFLKVFRKSRRNLSKKYLITECRERSLNIIENTGIFAW